MHLLIPHFNIIINNLYFKAFDLHYSYSISLLFSIPKIYFGSRTHKQITQIIRELNKTNYKHTR